MKPLKLIKNETHTFSFLAQAYLLDGKSDKAINYINKAISLCPNRMILRIRDI